MKQIKLVFFFFFSTLFTQAQQATISPFENVDKIAMKLPDSLAKTTQTIANYMSAHFQNDSDKVRAIFAWTASNIDYDAANMFAINFYETKEEKIAKALATKKGICENYAEVFSDICKKAGIESYVVGGYTKQNGFADYIPHAWCAARIDTSWFMFDPTWGSGYVREGKFYKKINNLFYKVKPITFIKSHMPFDYLWQFLNYPITNQDFYEGKVEPDESKKEFFNYRDSIAQYEKQDRIEQLLSIKYRVERNGIKNSMIFDRLQHVKLEMEHIRQNNMVGNFNTAVAEYNEGVVFYNDFINYRNKQFTPAKPDAEIQTMLNFAKDKLVSAKARLNAIKDANDEVKSSTALLTKTIDDLYIQVKEQQDWLKIYFSKGKLGRKLFFLKRG